MDFNSRISLVLDGYSPDWIGLLTRTLNQRINIKESKVRELLGPVNEALDWATVSRGEQRTIKATTDELITNLAGPRPPDLQVIINFINQYAARFRVDLDSDRVMEFAKYIVENWNDLMDLMDVTDSSLLEPNPEDPEFERRLASVPSYRKPN